LLNELFKRFSSKPVERRAGARIRKKYPIAWVRGAELVPAAGIEIGETSVLFAVKTAPPGPKVDVVIELDKQRRVRVRVVIVRSEPVPREGVTWTLIAATYEGIAADDWDAIVRFCRDQPEPENKAAGELATLASTNDDAYRLLPLKIQQRVVEILSRAGRLAPWDEHRSPLLRMTYAGVSRSGVHRLTVHSRLSQDAEVMFFDSIVTVDEAGNVVLER
jgi:hypothetical protein